MAGDTSCSYAANATIRRACSMPRIPTTITASRFSAAANALASLICPPWAIDGTAQRGVSRNCALGSDGERAEPYRSSHEACTRRRTNVFWGSLPTTRPSEIRARATLERAGQTSTEPICGSNAIIGLPPLADGPLAEPIFAWARRRTPILTAFSRPASTYGPCMVI